jgi:hypothetical protein
MSKADVRGRMPDVRREKREVRSQETGGGRRKAESRRQKAIKKNAQDD